MNANAASPDDSGSVSSDQIPTMDEKNSVASDAKNSQNSVNRRLRQSGIWIVFWRLVGTVLGLITNVAVSHLLSPAAFGGFVVALNVINGGGIIARFGADRSIIKLAGRAFAVGERSVGLRALRLGLSLATISSLIVGAVVYFALGPFMDRLGLDGSLTALVSLGIMAVALLHVFVESHRVFQEVRVPALLAAYGTGPVLNLVFLIFLACTIWSTPSLFSTLTAYVVSIALLLPPALFSLYRFAAKPSEAPGDETTVTGHVSLSTKGMLLVSLSIAATDVLQFCLSQSQVLIAGAFCNADEVSLYATARLLTTLVVTPLFLASQSVSALIPELHARQQQEELQRVLRTSATVAAIPTVLVSLVFMITPEPILGLLFGDFYRSAGPLLAMLSLGGLFYAWTGPCATVLVLTGGHNQVLLVNMASAFTNVVGGLLVARQFGAYGLAVVTAGVQIVSNVALLLIARKSCGVWTHSYFNLLPVLQRLRAKAMSRTR
jgi:O-antigen/teichoic acid export membrane protein